MGFSFLYLSLLRLLNLSKLKEMKFCVYPTRNAVDSKTWWRIDEFMVLWKSDWQSPHLCCDCNFGVINHTCSEGTLLSKCLKWQELFNSRAAEQCWESVVVYNFPDEFNFGITAYIECWSKTDGKWFNIQHEVFLKVKFYIECHFKQKNILFYFSLV